MPSRRPSTGEEFVEPIGEKFARNKSYFNGFLANHEAKTGKLSYICRGVACRSVMAIYIQRRLSSLESFQYPVISLLFGTWNR